jgi:hypothetical protein
MIKKIHTNGYQGGPHKVPYLPPGEYAVGRRLDIGKRIVTSQIAEYMVGIELARVIERAEPKPEKKAPRRTRKVVED